MKIGSRVRPTAESHKRYCFIAALEDMEGTVTKLEIIDDEPMAFFGTPCGWQWLPIDELEELE